MRGYGKFGEQSNFLRLRHERESTSPLVSQDISEMSVLTKTYPCLPPRLPTVLSPAVPPAVPWLVFPSAERRNG